MFKKALEKAKEDFGVSFTLKEKQEATLHGLYEGKDVLCLLKTGYGKFPYCTINIHNYVVLIKAIVQISINNINIFSSLIYSIVCRYLTGVFLSLGGYSHFKRVERCH
jgi:hypothetical protein